MQSIAAQAKSREDEASSGVRFCTETVRDTFNTAVREAV